MESCYLGRFWEIDHCNTCKFQELYILKYMTQKNIFINSMFNSKFYNLRKILLIRLILCFVSCKFILYVVLELEVLDYKKFGFC